MIEIKTKLIPITWIDFRYPYSYGYGCGYIGVPPEHPWHGKDYNELENVYVHGGLTWAADYVRTEPKDGYWWLGFDTCHYGDNKENCSREYCLEQIELLKNQAIEAFTKIN